MKTTPKPPSPICSSSLYGPMTVPGPSLAGRSTVATGSPGSGRSRRKPPACLVGPQQGLDPPAQPDVAAARRVEERGPLLRRRSLDRAGEDRQHLRTGVFIGITSAVRPPGDNAPFRRRTCQRRPDFFREWLTGHSGRRAQLEEPGPGEGPVPVGGPPGDAQGRGGLVQRSARRRSGA